MTGVVRGWLGGLKQALRVRYAGSDVTARSIINFTGPGVSVSDDPGALATTVSIAAGAPNAQVSVKAAATTVLAKNGTGTFGGVVCGVGDAVLQATPGGDVSDGLWKVAAGAWTRTTDILIPGVTVFVQLGTFKGQMFALSTAAPFVVDADPLRFVLVSQTMNVRLFGAKGDGATNDQAAFAAALAALAAIGGGTLYCPRGTYLLGSKITIPSGVVVKGDGKLVTILKATAGPSAPWINVSGEGMIEFRGVTNAAIEDLTVHGNGSLRTPGTGGDPSTDTIDMLVVLAGTIDCRIDRCRITEGGYATSTGGTPSGPNVLLVAKDSANDLGGQFGTVAAQDCRGNKIRGCTFDDNGGATRVAKGVGIITDFGQIAPLAHDYSFNLSRRQTTINGAVSVSDTNLTVADSHGFAIGDSIRVERAADSSLFDHGNVTAIPDATHVTIDTPVTRTYAAADKFGTSRDAVSAYGPGGTQAASFRGRAVDQAGDGRGRLGVSTTVRSAMSNPTSVVKATTATNVALGDTVRVTRAADHTLYDEGVVTAIAATGDITIGTPTTRTYAASDLVQVTAFSASSGFNGGDYFAHHAEGNLIEDNEFSGVFNLYAVGLQGGGTCRNMVQRNRFKSVRALNCVLRDKGAYGNTIEKNVATDHQRDSVFLATSPISSFSSRDGAGYYGHENHFERNRVVAFVGTLQYDAPFAVGENVVGDVFHKNTVDGATVPGSLGMGFMIGQGNIDVVVTENTVRGTNYGIFSNLGGAPLVPSSGGEFSRNELNISHQAILLSAATGALAAGGSWVGSLKVHGNKITGTTDVGGQVAIDDTVSVLLSRDNHVERLGAPGGGHIGMSVAALNGVVTGNVGKNQPTAFSFSGFSGIKGGNRDAATTAQDLDAAYAAITAATANNFALAIVQRDATGSFSAQNVAAAGQVYGAWHVAADGATVTFDFDLGNSQSVILGGNRAIAVSHLQNGGVYVVLLIQDGTGGRSVTWPAGTKWVGGAAPTLSAGASKVDILHFWSDGASLYELSRALDVR